VPTGKPLSPPLEQPGRVAFATFRPDGKTVATVTVEGGGDTIRRLDATTRQRYYEELEKLGGSPRP
jgi:hypothetical protein